MSKTESETDVTSWEERVHPDFAHYLKTNPTFTYDSWWKVAIFRTLMNIIPGPVTHGVKVKKVKGVGYLYLPPSAIELNEYSSAIMYIHGGGRIFGSAGGIFDSETCCRMSSLFGIPVLSAKYSVGYPFPAALDDLCEAYSWIVKNMSSESTEGSKSSKVKIAVAGTSAGGGLAAELCQKLLDESQEQNATTPLPVCQILFQPMLDDRTCVDEELSNLPTHLVWNNKSNMYGWSNYLAPHKPGDKNLPKYASASRRKDLTNLPPAFIQIGDLDLFYKECKDYSLRLQNDGVVTEFVEVKGCFHAMLEMGKDEELITTLWDKTHTFGKKFLFDQDE